MTVIKPGKSGASPLIDPTTNPIDNPIVQGDIYNCLWDVVNLNGFAMTVQHDTTHYAWCHDWLLLKASRLEAVYFVMGYNKCRANYEDEDEEQG